LSREVYLDRVGQQEELVKLVDFCMGEKECIHFEEFKRICEESTSEMFLCLFSMLRKKLPGFEQFKRYEQNLKDRESIQFAPISSKKIASPKILSKFSPVSELVKSHDDNQSVSCC
jgi:hypothetical protein